MDALRKSNLCMDAVLAFLEKNAPRLRHDFADGAVLGVYVDGDNEQIVIIPFDTEEKAFEYRDTKVPEALREGTAIVPVSANLALML